MRPKKTTRRRWPSATRKSPSSRSRWRTPPKNAEAAEELTKQIGELKEASAAERADYELKLAGCRSARAGRVLLADHGGDMDALKQAEPWLFGAAEPQGGTTGLEPAGPAGKGDGDELARWREIAGLAGQE